MLLPGLFRFLGSMFSGKYNWPIPLKKHGGKVSHNLILALNGDQFYGPFAPLLGKKSPSNDCVGGCIINLQSQSSHGGEEMSLPIPGIKP
jgi:hypothetical protein